MREASSRTTGRHPPCSPPSGSSPRPGAPPEPVSPPGPRTGRSRPGCHRRARGRSDSRSAFRAEQSTAQQSTAEQSRAGEPRAQPHLQSIPSPARCAALGAFILSCPRGEAAAPRRTVPARTRVSQSPPSPQQLSASGSPIRAPKSFSAGQPRARRSPVHAVPSVRGAAAPEPLPPRRAPGAAAAFMNEVFFFFCE